MDLKTLSNLLSALSVEPRAKLFFTILESPEPLHHGVLAGICGLQKALATHHLKILEGAGLITRLEAGKYTLFTPNKPKLYELVSFFNTLLGELSHGPTTAEQRTNGTGDLPTGRRKED